MDPSLILGLILAFGALIAMINLEGADPQRMEAVVESVKQAVSSVREDGEPVVVPYMNFYVANGALIVPVSGIDPDMDREALLRLEGLYPGREAVGVDARVLALGGGGIHCITQQVPVAGA